MRTVTGTVTETLTVSKTVAVKVPDDATEEIIAEAIRASAYARLVSHKTGWVIESSESVNITIDGEQTCAECGHRMRTEAGGVTHHTTGERGIDYERDADHPPIDDAEYGVL